MPENATFRSIFDDYLFLCWEAGVDLGGASSAGTPPSCEKMC